ncbi:class A beta-lactamase [Xenophilus arseniciresistens]|uniref:Beta-lactamase n=1 Tax=Xenophilus arseniciresistens TaxID=1283306 RepID=A0AAE3T032_9BURK|nr:class A beta-lactamase [Xenophilus arseniciresistens]MDA7415882.1 class A beta-lactamase [Xenophilus arseniciresistens]
MQRRHFGALLAAALPTLALAQKSQKNLSPGSADAMQRLRSIEAGSGGRLGVHILDTGTGASVSHRADERFPMCSTFKVLAAAQVLQRVDAGQEQLERRIPYGRDVLVAHSPVTEQHVGAGLTLAQLCEATITTSDNAAANLILQSYGGPAALTAYLRTLGDAHTRLDRTEPGLNEATPGDPRDTTTPAAMVDSLQRLLLGDALSAASRERLTQWMVANTTGDTRLRAGLPAGWRVGDKTGAGALGTNNDVAIFWPPGRAPWLVAAYLTQTRLTKARSDAVLADVARLAAQLATA